MNKGLRLTGSINRTHAYIRAVFVLGILSLVQAACVAPADPASLPPHQDDPTVPGSTAIELAITPPPSGTNLPSMTPEQQPEDEHTRIFPTLPPGIERIEVTQPSLITGEVPAELLESILEDFFNRTGIDPEKVEVVKGEAVVWPDGSLGCPKPGEFYTQETVNGYWIILEADSTRYDYRASEQGFFFLCEGPLPPSLPNPNQ